MKDFRIEKETEGTVEVLRLSGSLDMYSFTRLETQINTLFQQGHYRVVLECAGLDYIGSAGLGALIGFAKKARENRGDVKLVNVPDRILKIIELLGFTKVLQVHGTVDEALDSFSAT